MSAEPSTCAACGNAGVGLKKCTACKSAMYCDRACQIARRRREAELIQHGIKRDYLAIAAELNKMSIDDEALFTNPSKVECPICCLPLPPEANEVAYQMCCGQFLCGGCMYAASYEHQNCPFCRKTSRNDSLQRCRKRMKANDCTAHYMMGCAYMSGTWGLSRDERKGMELWHRAAELGSDDAHSALAGRYHAGDGGVERDAEKCVHHYKQASMAGHLRARLILGAGLEKNMGSMERAMKHLMVAASAGYEPALKELTTGYRNGHVAKDQYASTLRAYKTSQDEMKSEARDKAATAQAAGLLPSF